MLWEEVPWWRPRRYLQYFQFWGTLMSVADPLGESWCPNFGYASVKMVYSHFSVDPCCYRKLPPAILLNLLLIWCVWWWNIMGIQDKRYGVIVVCSIPSWVAMRTADDGSEGEPQGSWASNLPTFHQVGVRSATAGMEWNRKGLCISTPRNHCHSSLTLQACLDSMRIGS